VPESFHHCYFRTTRLVAICLFAVLTACTSPAERDSAALKNDGGAMSQLTQISSAIASTRNISIESFAALKAIRAKYPNAPEVRLAYKNALVIRNDWAALEAFFGETSLAELDEDDRRTFGKVCVRSGKYAQAAEILKPIADKASADVESKTLLGTAYLYLDRLSEAAAEMDAVWNKVIADKRVDDITTRGLIYFRQNDLVKAKETLQKALEIDPANSQASNALSQVYMRQGDLGEAEKYRSRTDEMKAKAEAEELRSRERVQFIYELETAWKAKNYSVVINLARQMLPTATDKNQKLVLYKYLTDSHKALGEQGEADRYIVEAQKLQQEK